MSNGRWGMVAPITFIFEMLEIFNITFCRVVPLISSFNFGISKTRAFFVFKTRLEEPLKSYSKIICSEVSTKRSKTKTLLALAPVTFLKSCFNLDLPSGCRVIISLHLHFSWKTQKMTFVEIFPLQAIG